MKLDYRREDGLRVSRSGSDFVRTSQIKRTHSQYIVQTNKEFRYLGSLQFILETKKKKNSPSNELKPSAVTK
jgi:hypothetical protein